MLRDTFILELIDHLIKSSEDARSLIAAEIFSKLKLCLLVEGELLTLNRANNMWLLFHLSKDMFKKLTVFTQKSRTPSSLQKYGSAAVSAGQYWIMVLSIS